MLFWALKNCSVVSILKFKNILGMQRISAGWFGPQVFGRKSALFATDFRIEFGQKAAIRRVIQRVGRHISANYLRSPISVYHWHNLCSWQKMHLGINYLNCRLCFWAIRAPGRRVCWFVSKTTLLWITTSFQQLE